MNLKRVAPLLLNLKQVAFQSGRQVRYHIENDIVIGLQQLVVNESQALLVVFVAMVG